MNQEVKSASSLYAWLKEHSSEKWITDKIVNGVFVSSNVRREALLSGNQGRITINGKQTNIKFEDMHDGVWRAYIDDCFIDRS